MSEQLEETTLPAVDRAPSTSDMKEREPQLRPGSELLDRPPSTSGSLACIVPTGHESEPAPREASGGVSERPHRPVSPTPQAAVEQVSAGALETVDLLLRDRKGLLARIEADQELAPVARAMICTIIVTAAIFGASLGLYRGGAQIVFSAVKLPLVILLTAALSTPALSALRVVIEGHTRLRRDVALVLSSLALGSLVLAALAPVVMLAVGWGASYHSLVLLAVGCCGFGGLAGLSLFVRGTRDIAPSGRALIVSVVLLFVGLVGAQMTWTMRPYLVRPRTEAAPFVRSLEGSFLDSVGLSTWSAMGVYSREEAPLPEVPELEREVRP